MQIFKILFLSIVLLLLSGCARVPFKEKEPLKDAALVYVYVSSESGINDTDRKPSYKITINEKQAEGYMHTNEYMVFDVQAKHTEFLAARADIEIHSLSLDLKAGETYYLRIKSYSDDFGKFEFKQIEHSLGLKELKSTYLAASVEKEKLIDELTEPLKSKDENTAETSKNISKTDELAKAYKLKEQGVLNDEEFEKLKTEILSQ
ncbi:DUF2846 domain-containing protein [bacterium]|nr:DUF2846 domain-containing protein [bacterium]MBU1989540.1 DUF2846 domain-containing protein [bacterium]